MNLFRPYENTTSSQGATSATTTPPASSAAGQPRGGTDHLNSMAAAATMAAAAMAMARAAALHQHQTGVNPPEGMMMPGLHPQQMAAFNHQVAGAEEARSSPISDPGSPPQSPNGINLTKANGNAVYDIVPKNTKDLDENIKINVDDDEEEDIAVKSDREDSKSAVEAWNGEKPGRIKTIRKFSIFPIMYLAIMSENQKAWVFTIALHRPFMYICYIIGTPNIIRSQFCSQSQLFLAWYIKKADSLSNIHRLMNLLAYDDEWHF